MLEVGFRSAILGRRQLVRREVVLIALLLLDHDDKVTPVWVVEQVKLIWIKTRNQRGESLKQSFKRLTEIVG
jgi:hypothetical protein